MKLTNNERIALDMIARNTYQPVNGGVPETFDDVGSIWSNLITDTSSDETIQGRTLSATCASLSKKGLVTTTDADNRRGEPNNATITMTEAGFNAWKESRNA